MTAKQTQFIISLMTERETASLSPDQQMFLARIHAGHVDPTAEQASRIITKLLSLPRRGETTETTTTTAAPAVDVPAGRYAIEIGGKVGFFRVDRPEDGKWAGRTFVKEQASEEFYPVRGPRRNEVLTAIAADPRAAMIRYGHELGRCGNCGRTLTDEISREMGIGPDCAKHLGIERGSASAPAPRASVAPSSDHFVDQQRDLAEAREIEQTTAAPAREPLVDQPVSDDETYAFGGGDRADVAAEEAAERGESYPGLRAAAGKTDPSAVMGWRERKQAVVAQQADGGSSRERYAAIAAKSGRVHHGELPGSTWEDIFNMGAGA